jgi:hypothetical protein
VARADADANVTLTPAGNADPGRVTLMRDFAGGVLIGAERGCSWQGRRRTVVAPSGEFPTSLNSAC